MLPHERHPQRQHRHVAHGQLPRRHEREVQRIGRQPGHDVAGARPPQGEAGVLSGHVGDPGRGAGAGGLLAQPAEVVRAERGAGDDQELLLTAPGDGEVALDAAAPVERLRVGDGADLAGDPVVADPLQQLGGVRAGDLDLGERALVEQPGGRAGGPVLGADRGRPEPPGPSARPLARSIPFVGRVVVDPLPARLLPEDGAVSGVPAVGGRQAQRPPRRPFVAGVADVVVRLIVLDRPLERVRRRTVLAAEAAHVHVPDVHARLAVHDPLGHDPADAARARDAVGAEPGRHVEPAHLGLAQAELVVGGERLGAVDQLADADVGHRGHPDPGVVGDLLEPGIVLGQQPAVEVGGHGVEGVRGGRPGGAGALVAAHDQALDLLPVVDEQVGVAQRGQAGVVVEGVGHDVLVRHGHDRHAYPGHAANLGREHAAAVDHDLAVDVALVGAHARDTAAGRLDAEHAGAGA